MATTSGYGASRSPNALSSRASDRLDDHQNRVEGQRRVVALVLGRAQHVAWAEQLGAEAPVAADAADEEALEQQQADPAVCRLGRFVRDPRGARHAHDARDQIAPGGLQAAAVEPVRQIGVVDEDVAHQSRHPSHVRAGALAPPVAPGVWGARSHAEARAGDDRPVALGFAIACALAFALTNGFHDAANAIATLVATRGARRARRSCSPRSSTCRRARSSGTAVADTIAGIVDRRAAEAVAVIGSGRARRRRSGTS